MAIMLFCTGCAAQPATVSALPTAIPSNDTSEGPDPPVSSATPAPSASALNCVGPIAAARATPASQVGPYGAREVTGSADVALTFDDGPDPVNTPLMLDALRECGVKATFCVIGNKVSLYADVIRRIVAEGHTLCNHTWSHNTQLGSYGQAAIRQELQRTNDALHAIVPNAPIAYFRAPGGMWTADYVTVARQLGMTPLDWSVDPWDWNFAKYGTGDAMTTHVVSWVEANVRPGSIVLSHDNEKPATVAAYRILLPWLKARFILIALPTGQA
jgi:peptidoglycan/xylan/chitin deacetylase (PgdA/CDA1 family)